MDGKDAWSNPPSTDFTSASLFRLPFHLPFAVYIIAKGSRANFSFYSIIASSFLSSGSTLE